MADWPAELLEKYPGRLLTDPRRREALCRERFVPWPDPPKAASHSLTFAQQGWVSNERFGRGSDRVIGRNSSAKRKVTYAMGGASGEMGAKR